MIKVKIIKFNAMMWDAEHMSIKLAEKVNEIGEDRILHITAAVRGGTTEYTIFYRDND